jgi:hypothetical protein
MMAILLTGCAGMPASREGGPILPTESTTTAATVQVVPTSAALTPNPTSLPAFDLQSCIELACLADGHFILLNPIPASANQAVTGIYRFGSTLEGEREIHHGVEFNNPSGTPVLAVAEGEVLFAGNDAEVIFGLNPNFYGNLVILEHHLPGIESALYTLYAHLSAISVETGDEVSPSQQVGNVGRTGSAQGSHLHFEVRLGENTYDAAVNPELWLTLTPGYEATRYGALAGVFQDIEGKPVRITDIRLEYSQVENGAIEDRLALSTYYDDSLSSDPVFHENFAISSLIPGWYRVTAIASGKYISLWVPVESGKLTFLAIPLPKIQ